jgi:hypothetical protein
MTEINVLERLVAVNLDIRIWTARKKLLPLDLEATHLPPEDLASLGSKKVCNPEDLKRFYTLKARANTLLERHGIRFLNGWIVPDSGIQMITDELAIIKNEFNATKEDFLQRYDRSVQEWIAKHPQWSSIIANSIVSEEHVRAKLDFRWHMFKVTMPSELSTQDNLLEDVTKLDTALFDEIAKCASDAWKYCYLGKTEITRKALSPLKVMHEKLIGLSFIEPRVAPVAELIETALKSIPKRGAISGSILVMLQGLLSLLQNPSVLLEHGRMILEGRSHTQDIVDLLLQGSDINIENDFGIDTENIEEQNINTQSISPVIENHGLW